MVAALVVSRFLTHLLFGVSPADPITFTFAAVLLLSVALLAGYVPARRATKIDPKMALGME